VLNAYKASVKVGGHKGLGKVWYRGRHQNTAPDPYE